MKAADAASACPQFKLGLESGPSKKVDGMAVFRRPQLSFARSGAIVLSASLALVMLSGCAPDEPSATNPPNAAPSSPATPAPAPSDSPSAEPVETPEPTPQPTPTYTPIGFGCTDMISLQAMYDFNPNFGTDPDYSPAGGSLAAKIADFEGLTCGWVNQSSGETIEVAVANLDDVTLTDLKNEAMMISNPVPSYGDEGYFRAVSKVGEAQAFAGPYWLIVRSSAFLEPGEAAGLVNEAIGALPEA